MSFVPKLLASLIKKKVKIMSNKTHASYSAQTSVPTVNITVNNNRLKRYNKQNPQPNYYLNNGQEFQLELFNPTQDIVKADISLNNVKLSGGGLVLKPGERVFLDRYLDSPRKFKFETYEVGNSKEVKKAIEKNGLVKVEFYQQDLRQGFFGGTITTNHYPWNPNQQWTTPNVFYTTNINDTSSGLVGSTTTSFNSGNTTNTMTGLDSLDINTNVGNTSERQLLCDSNTDEIQSPIRSKKIETGRVGEGSKSDQSFKYVDYQFLFNPFHTIEYQILPLSTKQTTTKDLNVKRYCESCGSKHKPNFKFCPICGQKV